MKKHVSQSLRRKVMAHITKIEVCNVLHIAEETYAEKQYNAGLAYLREVLNDAYMEDQFQRSTMFRKWWKNEWHQRDEIFLKLANKGNYSLDENGNLVHTPVTYGYAWQYEHNCCRLAACEAMQASWSHMMGLVIDEQLKCKA